MAAPVTGMGALATPTIWAGDSALARGASIAIVPCVVGNLLLICRAAEPDI
jgi:hypothetical protein